MNKLEKLDLFLKKYLPMFFLLCLSYNPIIKYKDLSKALLVGYTVLLLIYTMFTIDTITLKKIWGILTGLIVLIFSIVFFQQIILGFVTYPGVFSYITTMLLSLTTLIFYRNEKIDFIDSFIKVLAFLVIVSIPFWIINQFGFYGLKIGTGERIKTFFLYTSYEPSWVLRSTGNSLIRNSGMFWEPGAFAGYIILAIVYLALKNRKFQAGSYVKEVFILLIGLITTQSTTGYLVFGMILIIHSIQTYRLGKIIIVPFTILILIVVYLNVNFLREKIESQLIETTKMDEDDISPGRFGALKMDWQYIKSQPLIGNGWALETRWRFHPQVKQMNIGHGNGMSNIIVIWGIPFFLVWLYCVYRFVNQISRAPLTAWSSLIIIVLLLQGEQFLYYPVFLSFFFLPFIYKNVLSEENKIFILKSFLFEK